MSTDTGTLGASVIQLPALQALPDPTGTGAALQALTTANMFRDMSGQAEVSAALQKSVEMSASGDQHAAEQAQKAMASLLEHQQKMARTAVDAAKAAKDLEPSLSKENPSVKGALINEAAKDDAALASTAPTSPSLPQQSAAPVSPNPAKSMPFKTAHNRQNKRDHIVNENAGQTV